MSMQSSATDLSAAAGQRIAWLMRVTVLMWGCRHESEFYVPRHYQPKTATVDLTSMPPAFVRRIWRPTAMMKTAGNWRAGGTRSQRV